MNQLHQEIPGDLPIIDGQGRRRSKNKRDGVRRKTSKQKKRRIIKMVMLR